MNHPDAIVSHDDRGNPIMQSEVDAALALEIEGARLYFGVDEPDYGGAFDGISVSSDADCGL
jgi:hypothetical protein